MIKVDIHIESDLNDDYSTIVNEYWQMTDNEFVNKPREISATHNITLAELNKIIKDFSRCDITHGFCSDCGQAMVSSVYSQTSYREQKRKSLTTCKDCKDQSFLRYQAEKQKKEEEAQLSQETKFELVVKEKRWNQLSDEELEILKKIVQLKEKRLIVKEVFKDNFYDRSIWNKVNRIERLGLIEIEREEYGNAIKRFLFPISLEQEISGGLNNDKVELDFLGFSLAKNIAKSEVQQPDFKGSFILSRPVKLEPDIKYVYGGWYLTDGSINLKFTPVYRINQRVKNKDISEEPKHIKDIIDKLGNFPHLPDNPIED